MCCWDSHGEHLGRGGRLCCRDKRCSTTGRAPVQLLGMKRVCLAAAVGERCPTSTRALDPALRTAGPRGARVCPSSRGGGRPRDSDKTRMRRSATLMTSASRERPTGPSFSRMLKQPATKTTDPDKTAILYKIAAQRRRSAPSFRAGLRPAHGSLGPAGLRGLGVAESRRGGRRGASRLRPSLRIDDSESAGSAPPGAVRPTAGVWEATEEERLSRDS